MRHSTKVKQTLLAKLLQADGPGVPALAEEYGIPAATLYGWARSARNGSMAGRRRRLSEKHTLVLEARGLSDDELGRWLREQGLHAEQLKSWEREIETALEEQEQKPARDNEHKKQMKQLERELRRKERTLAEMSVLLVLKKKAPALWGEDEEPRT